MEPVTVKMEAKHDSVLMSEVLEALEVRPSDVVVDGTVGGAGHFKSLLQSLDSNGTLIGIDADSAALKRAEGVLAEDTRSAKPVVRLVEDNFRNLGVILDGLRVKNVDKVLLDLGWSGFQLAEGRGFSFQADEPLLMSYATAKESETAAELLNRSSEEELSDLIFSLGEERFARGIAKAIVTMRKQKRLVTTGDLVAAVNAGTPDWYQRRRTHVATKTFQALRIAVNDELGALRDVLAIALVRTAAGGRIAVITFHSIEDRIVKTFFREAAQEGKGRLATRKPVAPGLAEIRANRRARSAKLRVFMVGPAELEDRLHEAAAHEHSYV